jgi:hypothetical protein
MNTFVSRLTNVGKSGYFYPTHPSTEMQSYSISVPCKSYIKKYFCKIHGDHIFLDHRNDFFDSILTKLSNPPLIRVNKKMLALEFQEYTEQITFTLPIDLFYRIDHQLTQQQVYNINRFLKNCFKADLFMVITSGIFFGVNKETIIEKFAEKFEIELDEELSQKALVKSYYRYRKSSTAKNFFLAQMSSPFSLLLRY